MIKKITLFLMCAIGITSIVNAQSVRRSTLRVDAPAALAGDKIIEEIDDQGTAPWGTAIDSIWENMPVKYDPANLNGCATAGFPANFFAGSFALIYRGDCEFGSKALAAQNAGAEGVILVNNLLGVVGMGAGADGGNVTIPVVMVTNEAGGAMLNQLALSNPVTVSLTGWRFDSQVNPIDVGIKNDGVIFPQGRAMPAKQLVSTVNFDENFRLYAGGRFYNFSTQDFDTLSIKGRLTTPSGVDSNAINFFYNAPGVTTTDSIIGPVIDSLNGDIAGFDLNDAPVGEYTMYNELFAMPSVYSETGLNVENNSFEYNFAVTDSVYSKCEYDVALGQPKINSYIALTASEYEWGPLLYIRNGGHTAKQIECVVMRDVIQDSVFAGQAVTMRIYEWSDDDLSGSLNDPGEVTELGVAEYFMTATDIVPITGFPVKAEVVNAVTPGAPVRLNANKFYWVTVSFNGLQTDAFGIGLDYFSDYSASNLDEQLVNLHGCPLRSVTDAQIFPGGFANAGAPAVALHMSKDVDPTALNDVQDLAGNISVFPNPATSELNISVELNQLSKDVQYEVLDITGKTISFVKRKNVQNEVYTLNTSSLANGSYFVKVITDNGIRTSKFTIAK